MKLVTFVNVTGDGSNYLATVPDDFHQTDVIDWVFLMGKECFKPLVPKKWSPPQLCAQSTLFQILVPKVRFNPRSMLVLTKKWGWIEALPEISNGPNPPPIPRLVSREWNVTDDRMAQLEQRITRLEGQLAKTEKEFDANLYRVVEEMQSKTD